jgi:hypothetical protein
VAIWVVLGLASLGLPLLVIGGAADLITIPCAYAGAGRPSRRFALSALGLSTLAGLLLTAVGLATTG